MSRQIIHDHNHDGIDRRGFLECMAWVGTGALCVLSGGVLKSYALNDPDQAARVVTDGDFSFVQISDSHIGFNKAANPDVAATLQAAIDKINAPPTRPAFVLHTGDITQLSKPEEFDTAAQILKGLKTDQIFYVPGEHDVLDQTGKLYRDRYGMNSQGEGWYSVDLHGAHFVGLVNVMNLKAGGLGYLGDDQLKWLKQDLAGVSSSTPIVVFAHIPLWSVYPEWGWGTDDSAQALSYLKRFGSVTVLNGHIHQTMRKVEGNVTFHTAMSTAFPQAAPGTPNASPGPMTVPAGQLRDVLGITSVSFAQGKHALAVTDSSLSEKDASTPQSTYTIAIENFTFSPQSLRVPIGSKVTWVNKDEEPHTISDINKAFVSHALDTGESFAFKFGTAGTYKFFCTLHPRMTGMIDVEASK